MAQYSMCAYQIGSFCEGSNIHLNHIMYKDNIFILSILQICILHWYHKYIIHPGMDMIEEIIFQIFY